MTPDEAKSARKELGLTVEAMALVLGLGAAQRVYEYENGTRGPSGAVVLLYRIYLRDPKIMRRVLAGKYEQDV